MTRTRSVTRHAAPPSAPSYDALVRQADALRRSGAYTEAIHAFHAITVAHPDRSDAFSNLAGMLQAAGHPAFALQAASRAIELDPANVSALVNTAEILKDFGAWEDVRTTYDAALALAPASPAVRFGRALHLLTLGAWHDGWREHEIRVDVPDLPLSTTPRSAPRWDGSPLQGRHILLDHEQGLGDQVMCARFVRDVAARGGTVTLRCSAALLELFAELAGVTTLLPDDAPLPAHDVWASLMSLPVLLGVDAPERLDGAPYLRATGHCPLAIQAVMAATGARRVGLVWSGNPQHRNDARRSIDPVKLVPLLDVPGVEYFALQRHDAATALPAAIAPHVHDLGTELHSLNDTAHALQQLDLLVTVDTSVAHLAGALGVPTLLLIPFVPDWRWMVQRSDTPWYHSVHLLRQPTLFDWAPVIAAARDHIAAHAGGVR